MQNPNSIKVYIGSENPVKIACTKLAFNQVFPEYNSFEFVGKSILSGVNDQPYSDEETLTGATNRAVALQSRFPDGSYFVGIEGGIEKNNREMTAFAWIVILKDGKIGKSRTATFQIPREIERLIASGIELGHATDLVFKEKDTKRKGGTIGILTSGIIDRIEYYRHAVVLALVPFSNEELYQLSHG